MHRKGQGVFTAFYKKLRIGIRAHRNGDQLETETMTMTWEIKEDTRKGQKDGGMGWGASLSNATS